MASKKQKRDKNARCYCWREQDEVTVLEVENDYYYDNGGGGNVA